MPPLTLHKEGLTKVTSFPLLPHIMCLTKPLRHKLWKACRSHQVHVSPLGGCPHMCRGRGHMPPLLGGSSVGFPSRVECLPPQGLLLPQSTVRLLYRCGLSCTACPLSREPPPML